MAVTVKILQREGSYARFFVYDGAGRELYQTHRDVSKEMAEAKRKRTSLQKVLEAREG